MRSPVSISFAPYLRSTVPQNGTKRSYSRSLQEVLTGERMFPKEAILLFGKVSPPNARHLGGRLSRLLGLIKDSLCYRPVFYMSVVEPHEGLVTRPSRQSADGVPVDTSLHRYRCGHTTGRMRFEHWSSFAHCLVCCSNTIPQPMGKPLGRQG